MARFKQTKLRLPAAPRHVVQRNETDLVELYAVWSDIPLYMTWVVRLVAVFLVRACQYRTPTETNCD